MYETHGILTKNTDSDPLYLGLGAEISISNKFSYDSDATGLQIILPPPQPLVLLSYNWQTCKIFKVYIVVSWYKYTPWKDSHKPVN